MRSGRFKLCIFSIVSLLGYLIVSEKEMLNCSWLKSPVGPIAEAEETFGTKYALAQMHKLNKKMPSWWFEELYLRNTQPRETTCHQSPMNSEDPEFTEAFIPNIQLFMHREHLTVSEWNRLAHFNNPFGFMGYNYKELKQIVDLLPKPKESQFLAIPSSENQSCICCAVVANGGILVGSKMGKEIDSHDYVFRMDGAVIDGHEEDVGKRTSVYVHTAQTLMASLAVFLEMGIRNIPVDEGIKYVLIPVGLWDFHVLKALLLDTDISGREYSKVMPRSYFLDRFDEEKYHVLHPDFLRYVRNRFLKSWHLNALSWRMFRPTSAAFSLFLAVHTCDVVDAYGFLTADHRKYPRNYFVEMESGEALYPNSDYKLELDLWERLHNSKIIKLYKRRERKYRRKPRGVR